MTFKDNLTVEAQAIFGQMEARYNEGNVIAQKAVDEKRQLTAEEEAKVKQLWSEAADLKKKGDEKTALADIGSGLDKALNAPVYKHPMGDPDTKDAENASIASPEVAAERKAFDSWLRRGKDILPEEAKALSRLTDPAGGYLCMPQMQSTILTKRDQVTQIRQLCEVITTSKDKVIWPAWDDDWDMNMMGETVAFTDETDDTVLGELTLTPHKAGRVLKVSQELLEDQDFNLEQKIAERFGYKLGVLQEGMWIKGSGIKQPEGFLYAGITNHDIGTATSGVIVPADIQDFPLLLSPQYRTANCRWIIPTATLQQIILLRSDTGGAGTGVFMWQPNFQSGKPPMIGGYGYIEVPATSWPTIASDGHPLLAFGDLSAYIICDRVGFTIQRLIETYALNDQVGFKCRARFDGRLSDVNAFARLNRT